MDHYSKTFNCQRCGWSKFNYAHEFADGTPGDKTRICADCGQVETKRYIVHDRYATVASHLRPANTYLNPRYQVIDTHYDNRIVDEFTSKQAARDTAKYFTQNYRHTVPTD
jgi:transcription elongation factor Elf1